MSNDEVKSRLREEARRRRETAHQTASPETASRLRAHLEVVFDSVVGGITDGAVISGYWPLAGELDVRPLLVWAETRGCVSSLPVVTGRDRPLVFRQWRAGDPLDSGTFGTHHPTPEAAEVRPDIMLAPLLAFDADGYRIGWGGGYYDRSFAALRDQGPVLAVGVAYAGQQVDSVPRDNYDQRLDWVVTEETAMRIEPS